MSRRTITIEIHDTVWAGNFTVREGDRFTDRLCWEELLGQIATLTHPDIRKPRFSMITDDLWKRVEHEAAAKRAGIGDARGFGEEIPF